MAAQRPTRPDPGHSLVLPRVTDDATQRGFDRIALGVRQQQARADAIMTEVTATQDAVAAVPTSGRHLATQILTGTGTYNPTPGTTVVRLRAIGGGGGGGGASIGAGAGAGSGGSSGVLLEIWVGTPATPLTGGAYSAGAGGAGGTAAPTNGSNGGDSTIVINGVTYTAKGGAGGQLMVGVAGNAEVLPLAPPAGTSGGGLTTYGLGGSGHVDEGNAWSSGSGGGTALGAGGVQVGGSAPGNPGQGFGGGGSGGAAAAGVSRAGGDGAAGGFEIEEYS